MGTPSLDWLTVPAIFPMQFNSASMTFTLVSTFDAQITTLGPVSVRLRISLQNYPTIQLTENFAFTITKCNVVLLTQTNVKDYTDGIVNFYIGQLPLQTKLLTHQWSQTPNCGYPFEYTY